MERHRLERLNCVVRCRVVYADVKVYIDVHVDIHVLHRLRLLCGSNGLNWNMRGSGEEIVLGLEAS